MTPASSTLAADEAAMGGQGRHGTGERFGVRAKVAAGVAILGCAAALAFGGLRAGTAAPTRPAPAPPAQAATLGWEQHDYARRMYVLGWAASSTGNPPAAVSGWEQQDYARRMRFLSEDPAADGGTTPAPVFVPQP